MALRLPHVLVLMALILAAGVLSVRQLETDTGAGTVPGVVAIDVPALDARAMSALAEKFPGAAIQWVSAEAGTLEPFGAQLAERRAAEGAATVLVTVAALQDEAALRRGWRAIIAQPEQPTATDDVTRAMDVAAQFVRSQTGLRTFLLGLDPGPLTAADAEARLSQLLEPVLTAAVTLPRTRRTSIVILGSLEPQSERRVALRIDSGAWKQHARPGLADLVEARW